MRRRGLWSLMAFAAAAAGPAIVQFGGEAPPSPATVAHTPHAAPYTSTNQSWWAWARYCVARGRRRRNR